MAIYHLSVQVISRGQGRSCVAAVAYRAGEKLDDVRQGLTHDYTRRHDVRETWIQAPKEAPTWVTDRQTLWTTIDAAEKRKDAQTAREVNVALPRELTPAQQREAVQEFVQAAFVSHGMVADVAIHEGHNDQEPNPHAHILLTTRGITPEGFGGKNRDWNAKDLLVTWRTQWEITCNEALEDARQTVRIDARSLADQGVTDRLPTVHEGVAVRQMERRGLVTDRGNINRAVQGHRQAVVDLAAVRKDRQPLARVQQHINQAEAWRAQAGWPEPARQRVRGWEEQAGRVLIRADVTQWVQEARRAVAQAEARERNATGQWQQQERAWEQQQGALRQWEAVMGQAQRAQERLQREFSGIRGLWTRWRGQEAYQALQAQVQQGLWAEGQRAAWQAVRPHQQAAVEQSRAASQQAQTETQAVRAKVERWEQVLGQPWTPEEQAVQQTTAKQAKVKSPIPRQVPPQPLAPSPSIQVRIVGGPSPTPPEPKALRREPVDQDRGHSR